MRDTLNLFRQGLAAAVIAVASVGASAAVVQVAGSPPDTTQLVGAQSDTGTTPESQSVSAFSGSVVSIDWWGYDLLQPQGGSTDAFLVSLGGTSLTGTVDRSDVGTFFDNNQTGFVLFKYTLTLTNQMMFSNPSLLEVLNDSVDAEWYWQKTPGGDSLAYAIYIDRPDGQLPEPTALALVMVALLAVAAQRRTGRA
jgi:hypothetical protein